MEVRALAATLVLRPHEVLELRFYRRPFPCFVAITRQDDLVSMATFAVLRGARLKALLVDKGFTITCERKWEPVGEFRSDGVTYGLYGGTE